MGKLRPDDLKRYEGSFTSNRGQGAKARPQSERPKGRKALVDAYISAVHDLCRAIDWQEDAKARKNNFWLDPDKQIYKWYLKRFNEALEALKRYDEKK